MANNLEQIPKLLDATFAAGSVTSAAQDIRTDYLAKGSTNCYVAGTGKIEVFKGVTLKPGISGGSVFANVADTYASLGKANDAAGFGNVFNVFSAIFFIGAGLLRLTGASLLVNASSTLSLLIKRNGVYTDPLSGIFQAGLARPSAPVIIAVAPTAGLTGKVNGVVSVVVWRIRSSTGARSIQSPVSSSVGALNQAISIRFPLPDANGQDYWGIGVTKLGEGDVGSHFELIEIPEAQVAGVYTRNNAATDGVTANVTSAAADFNAGFIGWSAVMTGSIAFTSTVISVPSATQITLNAVPPTAAANATLTLTRPISADTRSVVIEWRDGDLVGKILAPTRDFPPPAALFGGTLEDIAFVDGALADAVQNVSGAVRGSAIAPSEPGRPESYSPDTYIFTNDTPTCLLRADGYYARFGANAMYIVRYTGGAKPLSVEPAWQNLGVLFQNNACIGEGNRIYTFSGQPYRMGGDGLPDSSFALKVIDDFNDWTDASKIVLGTHNMKFIAVCYCYGKMIRAYFPALDVWGAPFDLTGKITGNIKSCVTVRNQLILSTSDGTVDYLYDFNVGTGSVAKIQTGWQESGASSDTINTVIAHVRTDNISQPITIEVLADYDNTAAVSSQTITATKTGYQRIITRPNVADCQSHAVRLTITSTTATGSAGIEKVQSYGENSSILY